MDRSPGDIRLTPDGKYLLLTHFDLVALGATSPADQNARLAILDPVSLARPTMVELCPAPHGIAITPDSKTAYVSCLNDHIAAVDLSNQAFAVTLIPAIEQPGTAQSPRCYPYAVTGSSDGRHMMVSCFQSRELQSVDVAQARVDFSRRIAMPGAPMFGTYTSDGKTLYMPHQMPDGVSVINVADNQIIDEIRLDKSHCLNAHVARLVVDESHLAVVCEGDHGSPGTLVVLNVQNKTIVNTVAVGVYPDDLAVIGVAK